MNKQQLENRIRRLQHQATYGWHPADELEFRNTVQGRDPRRTLPTPQELEGLSDRELNQKLPYWNQTLLRLEGLIQDNDPRNPKRMIRDMVRGKIPPR